jgi:hypothetical protein
MELIVAMVVAFLLGAYIRHPWVIIAPKKKPAPQGLELAVKKEDDEESAEIKRMAQIKNMWDYTGKEQGRGY